MHEMIHTAPDSGPTLDDDMLEAAGEDNFPAIVSPRNARRSIEELLEERALRSMLKDLDQDFPDSDDFSGPPAGGPGHGQP